MAKIISFFKNYYMACSFIFITFFAVGLLGLSSINNKANAQEISLEKEECKCEENNDGSEVLVDIKGAVKKPGVYKLSSNSIINDVIEVAGGLVKNATTDDINLSKAIYNEMVIYVSTKNELKDKQSSSIIPSNSSTLNSNNTNVTSGGEVSSCVSSIKVNINNASLDQLMTLNGIGESKAQKIVEYRQINGLFKSIEDIKNVSGIGDTYYEKIKDYITV